MIAPVSVLGKRVFVVDDEAGIADTLSTILRTVGYTVRTFYDGRTALKHAQQESPDFVLTDLLMPEMDGITLATKLREQLPKCQVLLISGNAESATLLSEWRENGGPELEMLAKPVHPEIIIQKLTAMAIAAAAEDSQQE